MHKNKISKAICNTIGRSLSSLTICYENFQFRHNNLQHLNFSFDLLDVVIYIKLCQETVAPFPNFFKILIFV